MIGSLLASLFFAAAPLHAEPQLIGLTEQILRNAVNNGGMLASNASFNLNNSVAEAGVSSFTGGGLSLYTGLMELEAQPGSVTSIVSVSKTTGTLELSWNAPGLDGFVGDVTGGFYRIDTSSDPLHAFSPSTFVTEFATSVVPGDAQSYILSGLLPNTTYYSRIYLSDSRKVVAETSKQSDESTLANLPVSPVVSGIFASSVTFSWTLPAGGAEGFKIDASSTNFGSVHSSSATSVGTVVSLSVSGLVPNTTYFFKLGSLNWQSQLNFNTVIAVVTGLGGPIAIYNLSLNGDRMERKVTLTWSNPEFFNRAGVLVQVSTNPITVDPVSGTAYPIGTVLADGSVIKSSAALTSHLEMGLELDTTEYFRLYSKDSSHVYSVAVSTTIVLDLPPMTPAGLFSEVSSDKTAITLNWAPVTSNMDGSNFRFSAGANNWELNHYDIYRATGVARSNWVWVASAPVSAASATVAIPDPNKIYYYKVASKDAFGDETDVSMVMDTLLNLYAVGEDQVSRIKLPPDMSKSLLASGNRYGKPMMVRAKERPEHVGGKVVKSVDFNSEISPSGLKASMNFADPHMDVILHYDVAGGQVVPSRLGVREVGSSPAVLSPAVVASAAEENLAAYWLDGSDYVKLFGKPNANEQVVGLQSAMLGNYQIRSVLRAKSFAFDIAAISNKVLTPNGDGLNDTVVFTFDNPMDSSFYGKLFDMRGAFVADMRPGPLAGGSLLWDGKSGGQTVPRGVYIYQIKAESKTFNGTVMVMK